MQRFFQFLKLLTGTVFAAMPRELILPGVPVVLMFGKMAGKNRLAGCADPIQHEAAVDA